MSELHIIVLWEHARHAEDRMLKDLADRLEIVHTEILTWPGDPEACFGRFYGANLADARGKVRSCGGGPFRLIVVRDGSPRHGLVETSRGLESVNLNLFGLKTLYREWTGGGHKVHTSNSVAEAAHDLLLLTGHTAGEWSDGRPKGGLTVLPGQNGWRSIRELFAFLGSLMPYAVLRNAETLPDAFDPTLHGDIDLLVEDPKAVAGLLGARKVFPEPHRVHYEIAVAGHPVRFDFRFVGDGYYDSSWECRMLERRIAANGVSLLHPEDAFFALVYHALLQKSEIAPDYVAKAASLAKAAGITWTDYADALLLLEDFLAHNGYAKTRPADCSVRWNERLVFWRRMADEITALSGATDVRPARLETFCTATPLQTSFFTGVLNGRKCFIKHSPRARCLNVAEWRYPRILAENGNGALFENSLFWHNSSDGGSFVIAEWVDGTGMDELIARGDPILRERAETIAEDLGRIAIALNHAKIVHRDIRPANLIVGQDGHVTLVDFQFATPFGDALEDPCFSGNLEVFFSLGAKYALAPGQWNDRFSIRKILTELPQSPARDRILAELGTSSSTPDKVAACTRKQMKRMIRRRLSLLAKRFWASRSRRRAESFRRRYGHELEFLNGAIATWHVF